MTDMYFASHLLIWVEMALSFIVVLGMGALINRRWLRPEAQAVAVSHRTNR